MRRGHQHFWQTPNGTIQDEAYIMPSAPICLARKLPAYTDERSHILRLIRNLDPTDVETFMSHLWEQITYWRELHGQEQLAVTGDFAYAALTCPTILLAYSFILTFNLTPQLP